MRILAIMHSRFESLGIIQSWAKDRSYALLKVRPYQNETLPTVDEFDLLIIMGGPQSPMKINQYPYLATEINLIEKAIANNKLIFGVCLGAQLIGEALNAKTEKSPNKEVGVYPIELTQAGQAENLFAGFEKTFNVMHWHNDMPGVPKDAVILADNPACPRQIIRFNKRTYGFQCHMEPTLEGISAMLEHFPGDLKPSAFTQTKADILKHDYGDMNQKLIKFLNRLINLADKI